MGMVSAPAVMGGRPRSSGWSAARAAFLRDHKSCRGCGGVALLEVHHKLPFHLRPDLELDPSNLIVLCEAPAKNCHYRLGHGFSWEAFNPNVERDADLSLAMVRGRLYSLTRAAGEAGAESAVHQMIGAAALPPLTLPAPPATPAAAGPLRLHALARDHLRAELRRELTPRVGFVRAVLLAWTLPAEAWDEQVAEATAACGVGPPAAALEAGAAGAGAEGVGGFDGHRLRALLAWLKTDEGKAWLKAILSALMVLLMFA